jgi:hypothetical protein
MKTPSWNNSKAKGLRHKAHGSVFFLPYALSHDRM